MLVNALYQRVTVSATTAAVAAAAASFQDGLCNKYVHFIVVVCLATLG